MRSLADPYRDFAQSASNSIASNVSAPVDGIAWALRKAGVPVPPKPMGGSDWMAEKGLTRTVEPGLAQLLGEAAGMAGPMVAAAKAPQIAAGVNRIAENSMVPRTMNPQTGAVVWHGSPHKFDKFDSSKIGTGEGAQAYGHGLYLADSNGVANGYAQTLSKTDSSGVVGTASRALTRADGDMGKAKALLQAEYAKSSPATQLHLQTAIARLGEAKSANLYKVDLPDEHIAKMLDWDKPLSGQPQVLDALAGHPTLGKQSEGWRGAPDGAFERAMSAPSRTGEWLYRELMGNTPASATQLQQQGIPGIRYLDGGSRGAGAGSSNYVVFPGNESLLSILERNGQAVK